MRTEPVNLAAKLAQFDEHWAPRTVAQLNDYDVMVVKVLGEFVWHAHAETDDFFLVLKGRLIIDVEPLHAALSSHDGGSSDEARAKALSLYGGMNRCVQQESVDASIPGHIHEAQQRVLPKGADVAKASAQDRRPITLAVLLPGGRTECVDGRVAQGRAQTQDNGRLVAVTLQTEAIAHTQNAPK